MRRVVEIGHGFVWRADSDRRAEPVRGAFGEGGSGDRGGDLGDGLSSGGIRARSEAALRNTNRGESLRLGDHAVLRGELARRIGRGAAAAGEGGRRDSKRDHVVEIPASM